MNAVIAALLATTACVSTATAADPLTPEARAKATLQAQLAALPSKNDALVATFAKDAVVLLPDRGAEAHSSDTNLAELISFIHPHAKMRRASMDKLVAGGNASMAWFAAELTIVIDSAEPGERASTETYTVRAIEVLDAAADWKVTAAAFLRVGDLRMRTDPFGAVPSPNAAGPLAKLLASPTELANTLGSDPLVVLGTDRGERAVGKTAAKALLAKWAKLPFAIEEADKVREVHTASYGYAMADVNYTKQGQRAPYRMNAFVLAVPGANGTWSVVAAGYGAL